MIKRIKRLLALSKKDPEALKVLEGLTEDQLKAVPDVIEGDGKAVFFSEGSPAEFEDQVKSDNGLKGWYDRMKNL